MSSIHPEPRKRPRLQPLPGGDSQVDGSKAGVLLQQQAVRILELEQQLRAMQEDMRIMKAAMLGRNARGAEEGRRQGAAASSGGSTGRQLNDFEKQDTLR